MSCKISSKKRQAPAFQKESFQLKCARTEMNKSPSAGESINRVYSGVFTKKDFLPLISFGNSSSDFVILSSSSSSTQSTSRVALRHFPHSGPSKIAPSFTFSPTKDTLTWKEKKNQAKLLVERNSPADEDA